MTHAHARMPCNVVGSKARENDHPPTAQLRRGLGAPLGFSQSPDCHSHAASGSSPRKPELERVVESVCTKWSGDCGYFRSTNELRCAARTRCAHQKRRQWNNSHAVIRGVRSGVKIIPPPRPMALPAEAKILSKSPLFSAASASFEAVTQPRLET